MLYKTIFILFVIYFTAIEGQDREGWPEYNSYPEIKGWLKIHLEPADFDTARAKCHEEGAQLVNPYIPKFKENVKNLLNTSSTAEKPILAVYSLAKVEYVSSEGFEKVNDDIVYLKHHKLNCVVISSNGLLYRTECENKLPFVCYALNSVARRFYGYKLADDPELLDSPYINELDHFDPNALSKKN